MPNEISLITILTIIASSGFAIVSRAITKLKGSFIRSLLSYLLLVAAVALLICDTGGIQSSYIFLWPLVAAFAGLFGIWSSAPVFIITCGYFTLLILNDAVAPGEMAPTILITAIPIIFSIIVWSHVRQLSNYRQGGKKSRDPADYKKQPAAITNLIDQSETILNSLGDGVLAIDSRGIVRLINPAAQTMLGWTKQDALTLQYQSVLKLASEQGESLIDVQDPIKQSLNSNQENRAKALQLETKNGKKIYISLLASPLGEAGHGIIVVIRDITKERSEEHEQAEFISTASHEMRTPVASIEGYLGLALNPSTATIDDKAREYIAKAQEAAKHLGSLFQDLLDVSKADDGRLPNNPTVIDVVEVAGNAVDGLQAKAKEKGLQLTFKPAPAGGEKGERNLTPIYYGLLDKNHVRELVGNLTENAIKYTPSGEVSIDVTGDSDSITISIQDTGIGIPSEDIPHLFQKFYRVDNSDTREIGGTGLGLYLCRRLAETLGGRIWVESIYQQGSTFFIELPRLDNAEARHRLAEQEAAEKPQATAVAPSKPPTVTIPVNPTVAPTIAPAAPMPVPAQNQTSTPTQAVASAPAPTTQAPQPVATSIPVVDYQQPTPVAPASPTPIPTQPQSQPQQQQIQTTQQQTQAAQQPRTIQATRPQPVIAPRASATYPQQSIASMEQTLATNNTVNQAPASPLSQNNYPPQN